MMGDDIGYWNISAYNRGAMGYRTPNIDRTHGCLLCKTPGENQIFIQLINQNRSVVPHSPRDPRMSPNYSALPVPKVLGPPSERRASA